MKPYRIQIHQKLYEEDYDRRVQTAEELLPLLEDSALGKLIFTSDEATFHVSGRVHKQNCQIWGLEKPNIVHQYDDHSPKINVWCVMSSECIIGPFFFEESTINGQKRCYKNSSIQLLLKSALSVECIFNKMELLRIFHPT